MGNPKFQPLTVYRIYVPWNINSKNRSNHYVAYINTCAKFDNHSTSFSPRDVWKCQRKFLFSFSFLSLLYSCSPAGPKRLNRLLRSMAQNTWFGVRKCLLYDRTTSNDFRDHYPLKTPQISPHMQKSQPNSRFQTIAVTFYLLDRFSWNLKLR